MKIAVFWHVHTGALFSSKYAIIRATVATVSWSAGAKCPKYQILKKQRIVK